MPWEKVTIDTLIDIKEANRKTLGETLKLFDKIECLFNDMKSYSMKFDVVLQQLRLTVDTEGILTCSAVSTYNTLLVNFANSLLVLLNLKVPSASGISTYLIKPYTVDQKTYTYEIGFKSLDYNWVNSAPSCIIDNMLVGTIDPCPDLINTGTSNAPIWVVPNLVINIGCSTN